MPTVHTTAPTTPHHPARSRPTAAAAGGSLAWLAAVVTGAVAPATGLDAQGVISPRDRTSLEASSSTSYPLGRWNCRVQQLHDDLGSSPLTLTGHAYRRDATAVRGSISAYRVEMSVTLSMSPRTAPIASRTFQDNVGAPFVALPRTWVDLPTTNRPPQAPAQGFRFRIAYATPFAYPAGGGTLCVDTTVWGNSTASGTNRNFTASLDAHELFPDGRNLQPGYRFGQGCAPLQGGSSAYANFELRRLPSGMELDIQARNGMPSTSGGPGVSALLAGFSLQSQPWFVRPSCALLTSTSAILPLPGTNTAQGHWDGVLGGFSPLPTGMAFHLQIASGHPLDGVALADASQLVVPPPGPQPVPAARIAHGSDRTSPTGTVSLVVPVTEFR